MFPASELTKYFSVGDYVRVIEGAPPSIRGPAQARSAGKHSGLSGLVVKNDPQLRIVSIFVESTCKVARLHGMTARLT